jgi:hypothetical protein
VTATRAARAIGLAAISSSHPAEAFELPPGKSGRFTLVEVTMFAGRSPDAKRRLYRAVVTILRRQSCRL